MIRASFLAHTWDKVSENMWVVKWHTTNFINKIKTQGAFLARWTAFYFMCLVSRCPQFVFGPSVYHLKRELQFNPNDSAYSLISFFIIYR